MRIAQIKHNTQVDGPGDRIAIFVQGCSIRCPGCQNKHLWNKAGGEYWRPEDLAFELVKSGLPITVSGGEPFDQSEELAVLLERVRDLDPNRHVIVYTGYEFEELVYVPRDRHAAHILSEPLIDVLVDGEYVKDLDLAEMQYRGSLNQRVIDVPATMNDWPFGDVVELDWDTPELVLTPEGDLLAATPLALEFSELGSLCAARRCGQTS